MPSRLEQLIIRRVSHVAAHNGWLDGERAVMESLIGFKRARADGGLTYAAVEAARRLKAG
jgi:porphobilinogen synthase